MEVALVIQIVSSTKHDLYWIIIISVNMYSHQMNLRESYITNRNFQNQEEQTVKSIQFTQLYT